MTERGQQPVGDIGRQVRNAVTLHTLPSKIGDLVAGVRRRGGVASLPKGVAVLVDSHKALSYQRALATFTNCSRSSLGSIGSMLFMILA